MRLPRGRCGHWFAVPVQGSGGGATRGSAEAGQSGSWQKWGDFTGVGC